MIGVHPLGKYIITFASLLHVGWAVLIMIDARACKATPVSILYSLAQGDRVFLVAILFVVAGLALAFLDFRLRQQVHEGILAMLLVPQQFVLWCSAGAGFVAVLHQQYADGVPRSWVHILADQLPVMLMALLYTVALLDVHATTAKIVVIPVTNGKVILPMAGDKIVLPLLGDKTNPS